MTGSLLGLMELETGRVDAPFGAARAVVREHLADLVEDVADELGEVRSLVDEAPATAGQAVGLEHGG